MRRFVHVSVGVFFLFFFVSGFAFIQCPGSSNFIDLGDTINQVIQKCGSPQKTVEVKAKAALWTYTLMSLGRDRVGFSLYFKGNSVAKMMTTQGREKTSINCPRGRISIGSSPRQVVAACGQPGRIQNVSRRAQKKMGRITHLIYRTRLYLPATTLIFKNGRLVGSK